MASHPVSKLALRLTLAAAAALPARTASACGGCFSPPVPPEQTSKQVVVQDAERVFFHRDPKTATSTVWVEVRYSGLAKDFGWVLPLPKQPKVGVGVKAFFDGLDARMAPKFQTQLEPAENCRDPNEGCLAVPANFADAAVGGGGPDGGMSEDAAAPVDDPDIVVLDQGQTGPYDFVVVQAAEAKNLYTWLNDKGYATPAKAVPILETHVKKGDVFVAIKLQNGAGVNLIRPLVLTMPDAEPCVPLRLTSIAAAEEMTVIVSVAGEARALPKNGLHVVVNPLRLNWFDGADNYAQVLAQAIDEAGAHAFATESAGPQPQAIIDPLFLKADVFAPVATVHQLAIALATSNFLLTEESTAIIDPLFVLPGFAAQWPDAFARVQALRACGGQWQFSPDKACVIGGVQLAVADAKALALDGAKLAQALDEDFAAPLLQAVEAVQQAPMTTRLALRISPDEMDRDPVFAFNPALPPVPAAQTVQVRRVCPTGWLPATRARLTVPGLGSWVLDGDVPGGVGTIANNATDPRFAKAPAALRTELIDEQGQPQLVGPGQVAVLDAAIAGALPGKPQLPAGMTVQPAEPWQPPPADAPVTTLGPWPKPPGCQAKDGWQDGKLPPDGTQPGPDAVGDDAAALPETTGGDAATGTDAGGTDAGALADAGGQPTPTTPRADDGCTASRRGAATPGPWALLLLALAAVALARRRLLAAHAGGRPHL